MCTYLLIFARVSNECFLGCQPYQICQYLNNLQKIYYRQNIQDSKIETGILLFFSDFILLNNYILTTITFLFFSCRLGSCG